MPRFKKSTYPRLLGIDGARSARWRSWTTRRPRFAMHAF
jgi:hypothetical protein